MHGTDRDSTLLLALSAWSFGIKRTGGYGMERMNEISVACMHLALAALIPMARDHYLFPMQH